MTNELIVYGGTVAVLAALAVSAIRLSQGSYHFLPTIGWCALMALPFLFEYPLFNPETRGMHALAIFAFTALMLSTDAIADRKAGESIAQATALSLRVAYALAAIYLGLTFFHLMTVPTIPLWLTLTDDPTRAVIDQARLEFSREYAFFPPLRYVFNLAMPLLGMPAALLLWSHRHRIPAVLLLAWILCYCAMGTAKGPFILAIIIIAASVLHFSTGRTRLLIARLYLIAAALGLVLLFIPIISKTNNGSVLSGLEAKFDIAQTIDDDRPYLVGDYIRAELNASQETECKDAPLCRKASYLVYRIFLTPAEVSGRWYEYFHLYPVESVMLGRRIHDSRSGETKHPALAVADWAFTEPFPNEYTANMAYAYASIDADAFGRYGFAGVAAVLLCYALIRLASIVFNDLRTPTRGVYYVIITGLLAMLPSNASIQAMAVAQGLIPVLGFMVAIYLWRKRDQIRDAYRGLRSTKV